MSCIRYFFAFALFISATAGRAQFARGDKMAGASVGSVIYNSGSSDISVDQIGNNKSKITSYNLAINPTLGWFITENTAVGATLNINPTGNKTTYEQNGTTYQSDKSNSFNIGLGGFVRHYFSHSASLMPFGQFGFNLGISNLKTEGFFYGGSGPAAYKISYDGSSSGGFFANASLQAGATKMMGENAGLDFFIGYIYGYNKNTFDKTTLRDNGNDGTIDERGVNKTTTKYTNHGFFLGVGFQVFLRKKK
ncbi:MAG: hypothetical protein FJY20_02585 [Bacteroidetes bacterium]|nr:hypothetical protein [Bacteroidota bacterium]